MAYSERAKRKDQRMPCYQCSHCGKCGMHSLVVELNCGNCGAPIPPGQSVCAQCGEPFRFNMKRGEFTAKNGDDRYLKIVKEALAEKEAREKAGAAKY